jgi:hypothetical protein
MRLDVSRNRWTLAVLLAQFVEATGIDILAPAAQPRNGVRHSRIRLLQPLLLAEKVRALRVARPIAGLNPPPLPPRR